MLVKISFLSGVITMDPIITYLPEKASVSLHLNILQRIILYL